jgi:hypothetical protein
MTSSLHRVILFVAIVAMVELLAGADDHVPGKGATSSAGRGPCLRFAEPFFDFGRVQSEQIVTHDYVFTNIGDAVLEISEVKSSCGCTAVTNWDRRVEPGKTGKLHVIFNTGGMAGPVKKNLWVASNDTNEPVAFLEFSATVWKWIDVIPTLATFAFGPDFQTNETRVVRLVSNLPEPVTLSAPLLTNRSFKTELKTIHEGKEFELEITVVPPLGPGSQVVPIILKTSSSKMPEVTVNVYTIVQAALTVSPSRIRLPALLDEAKQVIVTIRNNGSAPVVLSDPEINAEGASVQLRELQPGKVFNLVATFPAGFRARPGQPMEVRVKSSHLQSPNLKVPIVQLEPDNT